MGNMNSLTSAVPDNMNWTGFGDQGRSALTGNLMQYSVRSMSGRPDNMALLAMATKDDLICANNYTYISLNSEKLILLERLEITC